MGVNLMYSSLLNYTYFNTKIYIQIPKRHSLQYLPSPTFEKQRDSQERKMIQKYTNQYWVVGIGAASSGVGG